MHNYTGYGLHACTYFHERRRCCFEKENIKIHNLFLFLLIKEKYKETNDVARDEIGYFFGRSRPPERIDDLSGIYLPWRFARLQEVGWGPPADCEKQEDSVSIRDSGVSVCLLNIVGCLFPFG